MSTEHDETRESDPQADTRPALQPLTPLPASPPSPTGPRPATTPIPKLEPPLRGHDDRYEVEAEPFAIGGMGQIWAAYDHDMDREVAVKVLRPELSADIIAYERFAHESWVLAQLDHPGIVPIHDRYLMDEPACFTMRRVSGESLAARIRRTHGAVRHWGSATGHGTLRDLVAVVISICRTVSFAHSRGLVHRDVKPANVLLGDYGEILVMDWGIAAPTGRTKAGMRTGGAHEKAVERAKVAQVAGEALGTPSHMAPEQARGDENQVDERIDVFGIGATLFEVLTDERPWPGSSDTALATARAGVLDAPRERAPGRRIPSDIDAIVRRATASLPTDRYDTVDALRQDLEAWLENRPISAWRDRMLSRAIKAARRKPGRAVAATVLLVLALMLTVVAGLLWAAAERTDKLEEQLIERREHDARTMQLTRLLGAHALAERERLMADYDQRYRAAVAAGMGEAAFVESLDPSFVDRVIGTFDRLRGAAAAGAPVRLTAADWYTLGLLHGRGRGDMPAAIGCFDQVLSIQPDQPHALRNRAWARGATGQLEPALADLDHLLELDPRDWNSWRLRGVLLAEADPPRRVEAASAFDKADEFAPESIRPALRQLRANLLGDG